MGEQFFWNLTLLMHFSRTDASWLPVR